MFAVYVINPAKRCWGSSTDCLFFIDICEGRQNFAEYMRTDRYVSLMYALLAYATTIHINLGEIEITKNYMRMQYGRREAVRHKSRARAKA